MLTSVVNRRAVAVNVKGRSGTATFTTVPGENLLEAALRQGADVPYGCASGTCGLCKARVTSGRVELLWPEAPGYGKKPRADDALLCQSAAEAPGDHGTLDLTLGGASGALAPPGARAGRFGARILRIDLIGDGLIEIELGLDRPIRYAAGQFGLFYFPGIAGGRAFSFATPSPDTESERVLLVVKRKPDGPATEFLFTRSAPGSRLEMFGPLGHATFDPGCGQDLICVVGGSGISFGLSVMGGATLADHFNTHRGLLVVGLRRPSDLASLAPFGAMAETAGPGLRIIIALSDEDSAPPEGWIVPGVEVMRGFAHDAMHTAMAGHCADLMAYVAGPPPMIQAVQRVLLLEAKLPAGNILCDTFY
ncbi:2Fe-2S iron-sulfur cluster binding domain-containing protein [Roseovarius amoyensis]|uniref:2Fe-2S iron-sulfur cluster binding domain-containing protein n=1 Tax=Roseovarius amoyensis TaxID=2211448 RepID=UPI000DBE9902|nr:2Fe-2S iron-sulfur cluster binding domain-containing protein [Roseovarius amoyensis]